MFVDRRSQELYKNPKEWKEERKEKEKGKKEKTKQRGD